MNSNQEIVLLTPEQKNGWVVLGESKQATFNELLRSELEIQGELKGFETLELKPIQEVILKVKNIAAEAKSRRLSFTNNLKDRLIEPSMEFEKRNDAIINIASVRELNLRKEEEKKQEAANNKLKEAAALETHIKNEFFRIKTEYKNALEIKSVELYTKALKDKIKVKDISTYIESAKAELLTIQLGKFVKYQRLLINDDEAKVIASKVTKYDCAFDQKEAVENFVNRFEMYAQDLKNADAAIASQEAQAQETIAANTHENLLESSTNSLVGEALELSGGVVVKRKKKIIVEDNEKFAVTIITLFMKNYPEAVKNIGVKSWGKLVDPFTKALDKLDKEFPELKYEEICK